MIKITIKFFAKIKEDIGHNKIEIILKSPTLVSEVLETVSKDFGIDITKRKNYMFAKNLEYCNTSEVLKDGDELAIIPPVSGG